MNGIIIVLIYGFIAICGIGLAVLLYIRSSSSRRHYTCEQCGEKQRVELMRASRCSSCGAPHQKPTI